MLVWLTRLKGPQDRVLVNLGLMTFASYHVEQRPFRNIGQPTQVDVVMTGSRLEFVDGRDLLVKERPEEIEQLARKAREAAHQSYMKAYTEAIAELHTEAEREASEGMHEVTGRPERTGLELVISANGHYTPEEGDDDGEPE